MGQCPRVGRSPLWKVVRTGYVSSMFHRNSVGAAMQWGSRVSLPTDGTAYGTHSTARVLSCVQDWHQPGEASEALNPEGLLIYPPAHSPHLVTLQQEQKHHLYREMSGDCSIIDAGTPALPRPPPLYHGMLCHARCAGVMTAPYFLPFRHRQLEQMQPAFLPVAAARLCFDSTASGKGGFTVACHAICRGLTNHQYMMMPRPVEELKFAVHQLRVPEKCCGLMMTRAAVQIWQRRPARDRST